MSIVRRLHESHAYPLMRVVQGVPLLWDPVVSTKLRCYAQLVSLSWSPCGKFIAAPTYSIGIQILDAVTLKQLKSFIPPKDFAILLTFSPKGDLLTWFGDESGVFITWDFLTGVLVSEIPVGEMAGEIPCSITYSQCGTMFAVLFKHHKTAIGMYDVLSGELIYCHPIEQPVASTIWTHGEFLQFATLGTESITIWEVGFTAKYPPTEVESLPVPNNFNPSKYFFFLPTLFRLVFVPETEISVHIWDTHHSKFLLNSVDIIRPNYMTFSPDGHFFAYTTDVGEIHLWEEASTGYILHQKLIPGPRGRFSTSDILFSPNGQSVIVSSGSTLHLWHITHSTAPSNIPIQAVEYTGWPILGFSTDKSLAVTAQLADNVVTVLNVKSSTPQLIINTGMKVYGLRVVGDTIVVVGSDMIVTWKLPMVDDTLNARANLNDSVQATKFNHPTPQVLSQIYSALVSPNFNYIALIGEGVGTAKGLIIYDVTTGKHLTSTPLQVEDNVWFTLDGHEIWSTTSEGYKGWVIIKDGESNITKLECLDLAKVPSGGFPWKSTLGNQVTDDGWILGLSRKQLLWLPHHWRFHERWGVWDGQFFALLAGWLPEVVILELLE